MSFFSCRRAPGTKLCRFFAAGQACRYGSKCTHSHGEEVGSHGTQALVDFI